MLNARCVRCLRQFKARSFNHRTDGCDALPITEKRKLAQESPTFAAWFSKDYQESNQYQQRYRSAHPPEYIAYLSNIRQYYQNPIHQWVRLYHDERYDSASSLYKRIGGTIP